MAAYLIVHYDVDNPDLYGEYQQGAAPALQVGSASQVLVLDPDSTVVEGENVGKQTVVLQFDTLEQAKEIYHSGEYQAVIGKRHDATSNHFAVIVNGFG